MKEGHWELGALILAIVAIVALVLGIYWVFWHLWIFVFGYFWPSGPAQLINPDFWPFVGLLFVVSFVGRTFFGSKDKD